jgi:hypothetical protein
MPPVRRLVLFVFLAAACGPTAIGAPGQSLSLDYRKGDVYSYSFQTTVRESFDGGAQETLNETAHQTYTVMSVDSGGTADLRLVVSNFDFTSTPDQITVPQGISPNPTIDMRVAADGRVLTQDLGITTGGGISWGVLPGTAVKPGDTWSKDYDTTVTGYAGNNHLITKSKYLRDELFQGAQAAVIETTIAMTSRFSAGPSPGSDTKVTAEGTSTSTVTTWIDRDAHRILKSHTSATFDQTGTYDSPSLPPPTVVSLKGDSTTDLLPG